MHSAARVACATFAGLPIAGNRPVKAVTQRVLEKSDWKKPVRDYTPEFRTRPITSVLECPLLRRCWGEKSNERLIEFTT
jgi:hypothetical protein